MFALRSSSRVFFRTSRSNTSRHRTLRQFVSASHVTTKGPHGMLRLGAVLVGTTSLATLASAASNDQDFIETPSGLKYRDIRVGDGDQPNKGDNVKVHYTGWLDGFDGKKKFDSSLDRGVPLEFAAGIGRVIPGWDEALLSMKVGTVREVIIPAKLGYGARGAGGMIPPNATLYFRMDLIDTSPSGFVKGFFNKIF